MKILFNNLQFIKNLLIFSPRQLENETKTAEFLMSFLDRYGIAYEQQKFIAEVPLLKKAVLEVDGKILKCDGCGMIGGKITGNDRLLNSLISSAVCQGEANINFNPQCSAISNSNYYFAPAISIKRDSLSKIFKAKNIKGEVVVEKIRHMAVNILVGNATNPEIICFAHYDSIKTGAIDNASGVSVVMNAILKTPKKLKNTLYVFSACEELSYDKPVYWGKGFRVFEKKYFKQMKKAKKIIVIDCVGNGKTEIVKDEKVIKLGFPIRNSGKWKNKIFFITGDFNHLMTVYHSDIDDGRGLSKKYLEEANDIFIKRLA